MTDMSQRRGPDLESPSDRPSSPCPAGGPHHLRTRDEVAREVAECGRCDGQWARRIMTKDENGNLRKVNGYPWVALRRPRLPSLSESQTRNAALLRAVRIVLDRANQDLLPHRRRILEEKNRIEEP